MTENIIPPVEYHHPNPVHVANDAVIAALFPTVVPMGDGIQYTGQIPPVITVEPPKLQPSDNSWMVNQITDRIDEWRLSKPVDQQVQAQGFTDVFKFLDSEKINKILSLLEVVDVHKVEQLMKHLKVDGNGDLELSVKINLK